jgi:hypothetical protein
VCSLNARKISDTSEADEMFKMEPVSAPAGALDSTKLTDYPVSR